MTFLKYFTHWVNFVFQTYCVGLEHGFFCSLHHGEKKAIWILSIIFINDGLLNKLLANSEILHEKVVYVLSTVQ